MSLPNKGDKIMTRFGDLGVIVETFRQVSLSSWLRRTQKIVFEGREFDKPYVARLEHGTVVGLGLGDFRRL